MSKNQKMQDDMQLLHKLLVDEPEGLAALGRMDAQRTQLALALQATVTFHRLKSQLNERQRTVVEQVLTVTQAPALKVAGQLVERVTRARMLAANLDPESPTDRRKFAHQIGRSIVVSPA